MLKHVGKWVVNNRIFVVIGELRRGLVPRWVLLSIRLLQSFFHQKAVLPLTSSIQATIAIYMPGSKPAPTDLRFCS